MAKLLTREKIIEIQDLTTEDVEVPEWGGVVRVKALSGTERDAYEASVAQRQGGQTVFNMENMRARLVSLAVVDEKGERLFNDADVEALGQKSGAALDRVFSVALNLAGMRQADIEMAATNFTSAPNGDSTSA